MSTRWNTRGRLVLLAAPTVLAVVSGTALAASPWSTTGSGVGAAKSGGITAPGAPTVPGSTVTNGNVAVSWSGATGPAGATLKYLVERMVGSTPTAVCASTFAAPITGTSCTDTSVPNGTYTYRVTTRLGSDWQAVGAASATVTVASASSITLASCTDDGANNKSTCSGTYVGAVSPLTVSWVKSGSTTVTKTQTVSGGTFSIQSQNGLGSGTWTATVTGGTATSNPVSVTIS